MLTREKAIEEHRKMWNWLAKNPDSCKQLYIGKNFGFNRPLNDCFLCEYAAERVENYEDLCIYCPLEWPGDKCMQGDGGLYKHWLDVWTEDDYEQAAKIALQIAELPEV